MQTLHISDQAARQLHDLAEREHVTDAELIERLIQQYGKRPPKPPAKLTDFAGLLADSPAFAGDPVAIQRAMRDEWD